MRRGDLPAQCAVLSFRGEFGLDFRQRRARIVSKGAAEMTVATIFLAAQRRDGMGTALNFFLESIEFVSLLERDTREAVPG